MKPNDFAMSTDGVCVYVCIGVKNPLLGKLFLLMLNVLFLFVLILALLSWVPGLILVSLLLELITIRYTLWNVYGKENLIINTKSVSYQHDYGFFTPPYVTKKIGKALKLVSTQTSMDKEDKQTKIAFISYDENDVPIEIHTTTLAFAESDAQRLIAMVKQLFVDEMYEDVYELPPLHLN